MHYFFQTRQQKGYSVIELVIYLALFALLSIAIINALIIAMKSFAEVKTMRTLASTASLTMERMSREIRGAQSIDTAGSTFDVSPGVLTLNTQDGAGVARVVVFDISSGALRLKENGAVTGTLTDASQQISNLVFRKITTPVGTAVKIEMTITNTNGVVITRNFYDTVVVRGEY
jgi:type II secretory pathway component PulJ